MIKVDNDFHSRISICKWCQPFCFASPRICLGMCLANEGASLQCNDVPHWLSKYLDLFLLTVLINVLTGKNEWRAHAQYTTECWIHFNFKVILHIPSTPTPVLVTYYVTIIMYGDQTFLNVRPCINSLRLCDAYIHRYTSHHWFR